MQLKWNSTTTYPNIVKETSAPKKISYIMHNFPVYYVCNHFYIKNIFHFPKKNNFMLVTPRTEKIHNLPYDEIEILSSGN